MQNNTSKIKHGFALVELMIACAMVSTIMISLLTYGQRGLGFSNRALRQVQAAYLLEDGAEAVKTIRDADWTNISGLASGTEYYLYYDDINDEWSLSTTANNIDSIFTRKVVFSSVSRNSSDDIVTSGGTVDANSMKVTITLSWTAIDATDSKTLTFYIFDILS